MTLTQRIEDLKLSLELLSKNLKIERERTKGDVIDTF